MQAACRYEHFPSDSHSLNITDLEDICPNDGLDAAEAGVEDADGEGDEDGEVDIEAGDLGEGEAGGVHHDGQVEAGQQDEAQAGEYPHTPVKPPLQVRVGRAILYKNMYLGSH